MTGYILSRLLRAALTMLVTVTLVFLFIRLSGDPAAALVPPDAPQEVIDQYTRALGLDQPLWQQYLGYVGGILQGNFGFSIHTGIAVEETFLDRLPFTLHLGLTALCMAIAIGIPIGAVAAIRRGTALDRFVMGFSVFAFAMPNFLFGLVMILVAALAFSTFLGGENASVIWPALTLGLAAMGSFARFTRSSVLETINAPYMRAAEARGIPFGMRLVRHAAPNAAIPLVTLIGLSLGALVAGSVVTEQVFAWPGVGQLLVRSVATRDLAQVQFLVLVVAFTMVIANLIVDFLYLIIDPRIRAK
ncbi:ABC transporter permease subunit [Roseobacter sp. HKCCD9010]|uniref:ABC transporter permease n=1 Tax=Rhodobacterales TaxID=204455 RepID=UPI00119BE1CF|nr:MULTISPECIES: ABC transporter permease [Rhodobacterales]MBF9048944.1 ABC transporter permease subunit [Rhodobacterales bacterium HKCCD4356]NNV10943.1 ABC transporter permease subunit [Roseobacter sp. HKCCD7357]NNV15128.1 ABC transporter permease subunit [Roseobacter sp. HKCCD8768]NNV24587.1 ABC transporter permease subunit [Roseobacter sp. HKCCD8192]NNV28844.1 ABC transporter permease subunit [Roseobacter sp. HKCCD9061]